MNSKRSKAFLAGWFFSSTSALPQGTAKHAATATRPSAAEAIHPFHIHISDAQIHDLRKRLVETRLHDKDTVNDGSQGVWRAEMQELLPYWGMTTTGAKPKTQLNALPESVTTIDGVDIQFIHVRSEVPNAMLLILRHGWPGSPLEFMKVIGQLTTQSHTEDTRKTPSMAPVKLSK